MTTELEHLRKMRELLAKGWTQGAWARDGEGQDVFTDSETATCFCLAGASTRTRSGVQKLIPNALLRALDCVEPDLAGRYDKSNDFTVRLIIVRWNDRPGRTQSEVLALIDRAIEIAEESE